MTKIPEYIHTKASRLRNDLCNSNLDAWLPSYCVGMIATTLMQHEQEVVARCAEASTVSRRFRLGDRVTKTKGSSWTGHVVGFYSTKLTPIGYAIESENEPGSVQIYPESTLKEHGG